LKREDMTKIVDIQMARLGKLLAGRKITIVLEPAARERLAEKRWGPPHGARPPQSGSQKTGPDPLSEPILSRQGKDGDKAKISAGKLGLTFNGKLAAAA